jgi:predicted RNA-binding protein
MSRYWIIVASCDHVKTGLSGGFAQACHGKASLLKRMKAGDGVLFYSPKQVFGAPEICQAFTAIGRVQDEETFQVAMSLDFHPFRRRIEFFAANEAKILPLIEQLSFIKDKRHWGAPFRYGFLEIPANDYEVIASQMLNPELVLQEH